MLIVLSYLQRRASPWGSHWLTVSIGQHKEYCSTHPFCFLATARHKWRWIHLWLPSMPIRTSPLGVMRHWGLTSTITSITSTQLQILPKLQPSLGFSMTCGHTLTKITSIYSFCGLPFVSRPAQRQGEKGKSHQTRIHCGRDSTKCLLIGEMIYCESEMRKNISIQGVKNSTGTWKTTLSTQQSDTSFTDSKAKDLSETQNSLPWHRKISL